METKTQGNKEVAEEEICCDEERVRLTEREDKLIKNS